MTGVTGGIAATVKMGDVTTYNQTVDQSFSSNPQLRDALKASADAIRGLGLATELQQRVENDFDLLTKELQNPKPDKSTLQYLFGGIAAAAGAVKGIIDLGTTLATTFGIHLPAVIPPLV